MQVNSYSYATLSPADKSFCTWPVCKYCFPPNDVALFVAQHEAKHKIRHVGLQFGFKHQAQFLSDLHHTDFRTGSFLASGRDKLLMLACPVPLWVTTHPDFSRRCFDG